MIVVHHLEKSRSLRILWALEELGLDYRIELYKRDPKTMFAPRSLEKVHPLGKSPVIVDGDVTLAESGAILEYLADRYGEVSLRPAQGTAERTKYLYWMHYAEGSLMPGLLLKLIFDLMPGRTPLPVRWVATAIAKKTKAGFIVPRLIQHLDFIESELTGKTWFAGEQFTAADIQMSYPIVAAAIRMGRDGRPAIKAWLDRIHARPAYKRALEKNGPVLIPG
jgi:glutathione S-transferase